MELGSHRLYLHLHLLLNAKLKVTGNNRVMIKYLIQTVPWIQGHCMRSWACQRNSVVEVMDCQNRLSWLLNISVIWACFCTRGSSHGSTRQPVQSLDKEKCLSLILANSYRQNGWDETQTRVKEETEIKKSFKPLLRRLFKINSMLAYQHINHKKLH